MVVSKSLAVSSVATTGSKKHTIPEKVLNLNPLKYHPVQS